MSGFNIGDRVRLKSNVFNLPANLAGTVIGNGPIPNSFQILLDDGTENCWFASHIERIKE